MEFSFTLEDETSIDAAIRALDGAKFSKEFTAPGKWLDPRSNDSSKPAPSVKVSGDMNFYKQRSYGRDFDDPNDILSGSITRVFAENDPGGQTNSDETVKDEDSEVRISPIAEVATEAYISDGEGHYRKLNRILTGDDPVKATTYNQDYIAYAKGHYEYNGSFQSTVMSDGASNSEIIKKVTQHQKVTTQVETVRYEDTGVVVNEADLPAGARKVESDVLTAPFIEETVKTSLENLGNPITEYSGGGNDILTFEDPSGGGGFTVVFNNSSGDASDSVTMNIGWQATGYASRDFELNPFEALSQEAIFNDITLNDVPERELWIQSGVESESGIWLRWTPLNNTILGISGTNLRTQADSGAAINQVKHAMEKISWQRSQFGAYQNRLEHAYNIDQNTAENTQYAESQIRDTNMAEEMVKYSNLGILEQAGTSMLSQANQSRQNILSLLQ
ncbi:MAG: flagellin [Lachnospiraceae bacterium]|nr:flagellin [Lachnospiraceae bacterium]